MSSTESWGTTFDEERDKSYSHNPVANQGKNVLVNYNFMLRVEGVFDLPCKSVHSFTKENEFEYVQEGGLNDYVHMLRKPVSKPFTFTVERYVGTDVYPPLPLGAELVLPVILMVAPFPNKFGISKRTFVFTGCTVMSKTFGELNAEQSGLLTEQIVIGYREMTEVTIPVFTGSDGKLWKFGEDKDNFEGNKEFSATRFEHDEANKKPKVRQWEFDGTKVEGKGTRSAAKLPAPKVETNADGTPKTPAPTNLKRKWTLKNKGTRSAKIIASTSPVIRYWSINPNKPLAKDEKPREIKSSATTLAPVGKAVQRQWEFDKENYLGAGTRSAKQGTDTDPTARYWSINPDKPLEDGEEARKIEQSAKRLANTDPKQRKWPAISSAKQYKK